MFPPAVCTHPRMRSTALVMRDQNGAPDGVSLSVSCFECGMLFEFAGIQTTPTVLLNHDRTEIRLLIREGMPEPVHHAA